MTLSRIFVRFFFWLMLAASLGALAYALVSQYAFGFEPCLLCQYQRIPYWTVAGLSLIELSVPGVDRRGAAGLIAFVFACGAALALYHVGVEQRWWQAGACSAQGLGVAAGPMGAEGQEVEVEGREVAPRLIRPSPARASRAPRSAPRSGGRRN